jgi:hypothetical protein
MMISSSIHFPTNNIISFFLMAEKAPLYIYIHSTFSLLIISWWYLGWFHILTIVNSAAINMCMHRSWLYVNLHSFGYMPWSDIAGSYVSSIFNLLRNPQADLHFFFFIVFLGGGYIVVSAKVLTMYQSMYQVYHTWIHLLLCSLSSLLPDS